MILDNRLSLLPLRRVFQCTLIWTVKTFLFKVSFFPFNTSVSSNFQIHVVYETIVIICNENYR